MELRSISFVYCLVAMLLCMDVHAQTAAVYEDEAAFLAAAGGTPSLIDFEGIADPGSSVYLGNPGVFASGGVTIGNNSQMFVQNIDAQYGTGSFLSPQGANPQVVGILLPPNTIAVGFSYGYVNSADAIADVDGSGGFELTAPAFGSLGFFGVVRETPIDSVTITVLAAGIDFDNVWFLVDPNPAPSGTYTDETAFLAELDSATLIDFEGIAAPGEDVFLGIPGVFEESGVTISNNSQMFVRNIIGVIYETGSYLAPQGVDPQVVSIELPTSTVAVGFSYAYGTWGFPSATVTVNGEDVYILPRDPYGELYFFGAIRSDTPIESVTITIDGDAVDIDNVWFAVDPSVQPSRYRDEAAFLAAVDSPTLIDFEGIVNPGESTAYPSAFVEGGVRIANESNMFVQNNDNYGTQSFLSPQGATPQNVEIQLPPNTTAVGFSHSYRASTGTATVNGSEVFNIDAQPPGSLGFFGVVRDVPIESISVSVNDAGIDFDNIWFVAAPGSGEPNVPGGGDVDTSFGTNGVLLLNDLLQSDFANFFGLGVQPGGGIVIAGTESNNGQEPVVQVARIGLDGALDSTFGDGGIRSVYVGAGGGIAWDMAVLQNGSILVSGFGDLGSSDFTSFVFKLDVDGDVDTAFGNNGILTENLDLILGELPNDGYERIVVRADGNILLGTAGLGVHQLGATGNRDTNFGLSGTATPQDSAWASYGLAEAAGGKVVFGGGTAFLGGPQDFIVGKYLADGSDLDSSFGSGGVTSAQVSPDNDELLDLVIDSEERIVAVGWTMHAGFRASAVVRWLPDGSLDPSFGWGGIRILDGVALRDFRASRVVLRPDGGLLLSGEALGFLPNPSYELAVISLNEDGTLDESFAGRGWQELDVAPDPADRQTELIRDAMAIHPSGKIVLMNWRCACMTVLEAPPWGSKAEGDHNGDGKSDILWRNGANGQNVLWTMDGGTRLANLAVPPATDTNWKIVGRGDHNGDGTADILWRKLNPGQPDNGQMAIWLLQGDMLLGNLPLPTVSSLDWQIVGDGDYNGDGEADILWRNKSDGQNALWQINAGALTANLAVPWVPLAWSVVSDGDHDGDGKADILWRNAAGVMALWRMNGNQLLANEAVPTVANPDWQIRGDGDYDNDGKADLLWRNVSTGVNAMWLMDGATRTANLPVIRVSNTDWRIIGDGDQNGDSKADILWRNSVTGNNAVWLMNGAMLMQNESIPTVPIGDWNPIAIE